MKILIIGSGGREEAIAHQLNGCSSPIEVFSIPGNGGSASRNKNLPFNSSSLTPPYTELVSLIHKNNIELVVVGAENYLCDGMADILTEKGIAVFGPVKNAARLESSKSFAKEIMKVAGVPTADYGEFYDLDSAVAFIEKNFTERVRWVLKADGLCAGKGVIIPANKMEALDALKLYFKDKVFGPAGEKIIIEEFMEGEEASVLAFTDGKSVRCLPSSQDHKRAFDGDQGPNTGGMGVYTPVTIFRPGFMGRVKEEILLPVIKEMERRGIAYQGILYAGLMIDGDRIRVVEFNVRFGDPECQCVLPLLESDLREVMMACIEGRLDEVDFRVKNYSAACVVLASEGYPGKYQIGKEIHGLRDMPKEESGVEFKLFHAGTEYHEGKFYTSGGRVISVCGYGRASDISLKKVINSLYAQIGKIGFEGCFYRKDIGKKGILSP